MTCIVNRVTESNMNERLSLSFQSALHRKSFNCFCYFIIYISMVDTLKCYIFISSVQFSHSVMSDSL